jgi:hypothetical protein
MLILLASISTALLPIAAWAVEPLKKDSQPKAMPARPIRPKEAVLTQPEMLSKLISHQWQRPKDDWAAKNPGTLKFTLDSCSYPFCWDLDFMPGVDPDVTGISTAGTVINLKSAAAPDKAREEKSVSLHWSMTKCSSAGGFIFFEDGSAFRFAFADDGSLWLLGKKFIVAKKASATNDLEKRLAPAPLKNEFFARLTDCTWQLAAALPSDSGQISEDTAPDTLRFERDGHLIASRNHHNSGRLPALDQHSNPAVLHWSLKNGDPHMTIIVRDDCSSGEEFSTQASSQLLRADRDKDNLVIGFQRGKCLSFYRYRSVSP